MNPAATDPNPFAGLHQQAIEQRLNDLKGDVRREEAREGFWWLLWWMDVFFYFPWWI